MINHQLETLLSSKLYGPVILLSFRNYARDVRFVNADFKAKFALANLAKNKVTVEVAGPSLMKGVPGRKERLSVCQVDNLIFVNLAPCLSRADTTSVYDYMRSQTNPAQTLRELLHAIVAKLSLTQVGLVVDRVELMAALLGAQETLKFVKTVKHSAAMGD